MHEIIWTRSVADWEKDKKLFADKSSVHHYPCIQQEELCDIPTATSVKNMIITSKFTVNCLQHHKNWWEIFCHPDVKVWCFGQEVSKKINEFRTPSLVPHCKNGKDLAKHLIEQLPLDSKIAFCGVDKPAFNIVEAFQKKGFQQIEHIALYKNSNPIQSKLRLQPEKKYKIAFASPSAVRHFFSINLPNTNLIELHCIGETTKKSVPTEYSIQISEEQSIESLVISTQKD